MTNSMQIFQLLQSIISQYGPPTDSNVTIYRGLMHDHLVDYPRELNLLKLPLEQGLIFKLIKDNASVPYDLNSAN